MAPPPPNSTLRSWPAPARWTLLAALLAWVPTRALYRWLVLLIAEREVHWGSPSSLPTAPTASPSTPNTPAPFDVICLSHVAWAHVWQRNHHTMTGLARNGRRVAYLQVLGTSYLHAFAREAPTSLRFAAARAPSEHQEAARQAGGQIEVRQVLLLPADSKLPLIRRLNDFLIALETRWWAWKLGMGQGPRRSTVPVVLWFYHPAAVGALDYLTGPTTPAAIAYDIQDEYTAFRRASAHVAQREARLLATADAILAGTHELYQKKLPQFQGDPAAARFFPCAVEFDRFHVVPKIFAHRATAPDFVVEPPQLKSIPHRRLIYTGLIDGRLDPALIESLAQAHDRAWQVVMVGPVESGGFPADDLAQRNPNIHFLGQQPYATLPALLVWCEVCLMPWAVNELTLHINPTKTLEYLASARPVVAVSLPDLEAFFSDSVRLAPGGDHAAFIAHVADALSGGPETREKIKTGVARARALSLESVVAEMEQTVEIALRHRASIASSQAKGGRRHDCAQRVSD